MVDNDESTNKPLTLKERIELLKQNQTNIITTPSIPSNNSTSTTTSTLPKSNNNKPKGIALIGLADIIPKSPSNEKSTTIESGGTKSISIDLTSTSNYVTNPSSSKPSNFSYPPLKSSNSNSNYNRNSNSTTTIPTTKIYSSPPIASPGSLQSILHSSITSPTLSSPSIPARPTTIESIQTSQIPISPTSSTISKPIPTKPKWLVQSTSPTSVVDSISPVVSSLVPKLPPRSNSFPSSTPSTPILPPRPPASSSSMSPSLSSTSIITPTKVSSPSPSSRPNRHRAPSADFESVSLSREDSVELAISLSPILDYDELKDTERLVGKGGGGGGSPELRRKELRGSTNSAVVLPKLPVRPLNPKININISATKPNPAFNTSFSSSPTTTTTTSPTKNPNQVSSSNIIPSTLSTFSTRSPLSPLAPRSLSIPISNQRRYKELFEKLLMECLNRSTSSSSSSKERASDPAWISRKVSMDIGGGGVGRLDGLVVKIVWELSGLKKQFLKDVWNECDTDRKGSLSVEGFVKGMWFIDEELRKFSPRR